MGRWNRFYKKIQDYFTAFNRDDKRIIYISSQRRNTCWYNWCNHKRIENTIANIKSQELISSVYEDIEAIRNGDFTNKIDKYFNRFYQSQQTLFDYTTDYITFFDEPEKYYNE